MPYILSINIEQLVEMPIIQKKAEELNLDLCVGNPIDEKGILGTIVFSRQINALSHRLPKPNYVPNYQRGLPNSLERSRSTDGPRTKNIPVVLEPVKEEKIPSGRNERVPSERSRQLRYSLN